MNPHTSFIVVAYSSATLIMLIIAILPIFRGRKFRQKLRARKLAGQHRPPTPKPEAQKSE